MTTSRGNENRDRLSSRRIRTSSLMWTCVQRSPTNIAPRDRLFVAPGTSIQLLRRNRAYRCDASSCVGHRNPSYANHLQQETVMHALIQCSRPTLWAAMSRQACYAREELVATDCVSRGCTIRRSHRHSKRRHSLIMVQDGDGRHNPATRVRSCKRSLCFSPAI